MKPKRVRKADKYVRELEPEGDVVTYLGRSVNVAATPSVVNHIEHPYFGSQLDLLALEIWKNMFIRINVPSSDEFIRSGPGLFEVL
jgi:hypothetical protein